MGPKAKVKGKAKGKAKKGKPKVKSKSKSSKGGGDCKAFPMEKGPTPSTLEPSEISRLYKIPKGKLKTEEDVVESNNYKLEDKLGEGGFAIVYFARNKKSNEKHACKVMKLGAEWSSSRVEDMKNELFIMEKVKHLYIVKLMHHFLTQSKENGIRLYIFMELADGGDFAKFCQKKGALTEDECKKYFAQIICGINHMHSLGIAHRDIKLQNVLLVKNEKSISGDFTLLVSDFGLSRIMHHDSAGGIQMNRTICGTPIFMAPEILLRKPYSGFLVDVWALGITLYIMMTLQLPFNFRNKDQAIKDMVAKKWEWPTSKMKASPSNDLKNYLSGMLDPDPTKRLDMSGISNHKWETQQFKKAQVMANKKG
ncbi:hypothetical protein RDWZM_005382 [Blomia tropicalis]|uniref:non-specific serine/threonine protein kinase n=1 Tax=Blomia tropicalis TaxID=40697 RepID=A0A9Q0M5I0_BLOTA|nr:hypothetical protein RDWZM_005382 [Blomia tropicalis]